jgi:thioredoxin reductase (NADPH)
MVVDDDEATRQAMAADLGRKYGRNYRIVAAASGAEALDELRRLGSGDDPVALLLVDHRMPDITGEELLARTIPLVPHAKRVLLTTYDEAGAAISALKSFRVDHYVLKPWQPAEHNLYPVLDDLLTDWESDVRRPFQGIRVIGYRFSPRSHETRDFLVRNCVPFEWLDIERDEEARRRVAQAGVKTSGLPIVCFPDGSELLQPTNTEIAEKIGLRIRPQATFYDLLIVGGGPAGLAASVYGASEGLRTLMVEGHAPGGQAALSARIENYLGFPAGLCGADLARRAIAQAQKFEVEIVSPQTATGLSMDGPLRIVTLADGSELRSHVVLLANGVQWRRLDVPGIERLTGAGVYYGGTHAEAFFCKGEDVYIVGGGNSAGQAALHFAKYARTVTMLVRDDSLTVSMSHYLIEQVEATRNVVVRLRTTVVRVDGAEHLETITLLDQAKVKPETVRADAMFLFIGAEPHTEYLDGMVERDDRGYILTGPDLPRPEGSHQPRGWPLRRDPYWLESSVPGVFVAGDVRHGSVKRVAAGVGEGAMAVQFVHQYLRSTLSARPGR